MKNYTNLEQSQRAAAIGIVPKSTLVWYLAHPNETPSLFIDPPSHIVCLSAVKIPALTLQDILEWISSEGYTIEFDCYGPNQFYCNDVRGEGLIEAALNHAQFVKDNPIK